MLAFERRVHHVPSEELGAAENEDLHTLKRMAWFVGDAELVLVELPEAIEWRP
jgi:hypothetical protein